MHELYEWSPSNPRGGGGGPGLFRQVAGGGGGGGVGGGSGHLKPFDVATSQLVND